MDRLKQKERVRKRRRKRGLIKEKVMKYVRRDWFDATDEYIKREGYLADTRPRCSCNMCGNIRRNEKGRAKLTLQELRFHDDANEVINGL